MKLILSLVVGLVCVSAVDACHRRHRQQCDQVMVTAPVVVKSKQSADSKQVGEQGKAEHLHHVHRDKDGNVFLTCGTEVHVHKLAQNAQVTIDGKKAHHADLKAGMELKVTTKKGDPNVAVKIEATSKKAAPK